MSTGGTLPGWDVTLGFGVGWFLFVYAVALTAILVGLWRRRGIR
jgi:hypothetical protein